MHFAVGMCGGAALMAVPCLIRGKGWRHLPIAMTLGGLWGILPDTPRLWREDFTSLPFAATLGAKDLELWLHSIGNLFFMHRSLDAQPKEFALLGLAIIIGLYNLCLIGMLWHAKQARRVVVNPHYKKAHHDEPAGTPVMPASLKQNESPTSPTATHDPTKRDPVIGRIGSG